MNVKLLSSKLILLVMLTFTCSQTTALSDIKKYFAGTQMIKANTGAKVNYMNNVEKETLKLINLARLYPKQFLKFYLDYAGVLAVSGNTYYTTLTKELKEMESRPALLPDQKMYDLAKCWATEAGQEGIIGHNRKNCKGGYYGECCSYGCGTALSVVMQLLIDEGVPSLGHRRICLGKEFTVAGISQQPHKQWGVNTVLDFSYEYLPLYSSAKTIKKSAEKKKNTGKKTAVKKTVANSSTRKNPLKKSPARSKKIATAKKASAKKVRKVSQKKKTATKVSSV